MGRCCDSLANADTWGVLEEDESRDGRGRAKQDARVEEYSELEGDTALGLVLSPSLGNGYLHYMLDVRLDRDVKLRFQGEATLIRYGDDFSIAFDRQDDAERVNAALSKRFERQSWPCTRTRPACLHLRAHGLGSDTGKVPAPSRNPIASVPIRSSTSSPPCSRRSWCWAGLKMNLSNGCR